MLKSLWFLAIILFYQNQFHLVAIILKFVNRNKFLDHI